MSETVHYSGKLKEIKARDGMTLQETAKHIITKEGVEWDGYNLEYHKGDNIYVLCDERYDKFVQLDGRLFEILSKKDHDMYEEIMELEVNEDGTLNYELKYYNGGCGFSEALEYAMDKHKKTNI